MRFVKIRRNRIDDTNIKSERIMAKIAVVGMGQGGMVAAIRLAKQGHDVTVFEKSKRGEVSYDWRDDIRADVFEAAGLPMPDSDAYCQKSKWLFVSPNEEYSLPVPPCPPMEEISVYRTKLSEYFAKQAENAGCKLVFETEVTSLAIENDVVVGIFAEDKEQFFDLVIDASGMRSPFRAQVPNKFEIQSKPGKDDVMYGYRAFFKRVEGMNPRDPEIKSTLYLKHLGSVGISWCNLNEDNLVDVLIGRVGGLSDKEIEYTVGALRASNPILSNQLVSDRKVEICLRMSIARAVADGYVAVGDSAFMTMPLMGSGIESSMKAGKMFADYVEDNKIDEFTAKNMWGFYHKYMTTLGADFAFVDVLKRWALSLDSKTIDWVFGGGLIEKSDLALVTTDTSGEKPKMSAKSIIKKVFLLLGHFGLVCKAIGCLTRSLKAKSIAKKIPAEYDEKKLAKWTKKYNKLIKN